jgi:hypothetical protein
MRRGSINFAEPERRDVREPPSGLRRGVVLCAGFGALAGLALLVLPAAFASEGSPAPLVSAGASSGPPPARKHVVHARMAMAAPGRKRLSAHAPNADATVWTEPSAPEADAAENP